MVTRCQALSPGLAHPPEGWKRKYTGHNPSTSLDVVYCCSVPKGLFRVGFLLTTFREFYFGIPTRKRTVVSGDRDGPSPALPGKPVRRQDHKASAVGRATRSLGWWRLRPSGPQDPTGKASRSQGWPGRVQRAPQWREGRGFLLRPLRNQGLFWRLGCLECWLAGLNCPEGFLLSPFPLRASDNLSRTCFYR